MARPYVIQFNNVAVTAAQDLFNIASTSGMAFVLHQLELNSESSSSAAELRVVIKRLTATVTNGSGGGAATISALSSTDATATVTGRINDTTRATTSGSTTNLFSFGWNVLNGLLFCPPPEIRPTFGISQNLLIGLETAPGSSTTLNGYVVIEEIF
jgi:hypothetical protein